MHPRSYLAVLAILNVMLRHIADSLPESAQATGGISEQETSADIGAPQGTA